MGCCVWGVGGGADASGGGRIEGIFLGAAPSITTPTGLCASRGAQMSQTTTCSPLHTHSPHTHTHTFPSPHDAQAQRHGFFDCQRRPLGAGYALLCVRARWRLCVPPSRRFGREPQASRAAAGGEGLPTFTLYGWRGADALKNAHPGHLCGLSWCMAVFGAALLRRWCRGARWHDGGRLA